MIASPVRTSPQYRRLRRKIGHDLAFVDLDGRRHYLGAYDTSESRERYHRMVAEWEASGRRIPADPNQITIAEIIAQYLHWAKGYYVKNGHTTHQSENIALAMRPLAKLYGITRAAEFGPRALKTVREEMLKLDWSRRHINRQTGTIKRMFKWAVAEELVPLSIYHGLQAVEGLKLGRCTAREIADIGPVKDSLIEPVKEQVTSQVATMIELQLLTGARPGEIVLMRPCDIDRSGQVWVYSPIEHKTQHHGHERQILIGPKAQVVLTPYLLRPETSYCFSPAEADKARREQRSRDRATPLSCGNIPGSNCQENPEKKPGERYTTQSYGRAIQYACRRLFPLPKTLPVRGEEESVKTWKACLTPKQQEEYMQWKRTFWWHPHQLRHNYATFVRKQHGLEAAQILLGHSKADVTQIYAKRDLERATAIAAKIG